MKRHLLNLLLALSLHLSAAASLLWVRSHWAGDHLAKQFDGRKYSVFSKDGRIGLACIINGLPAGARSWDVTSPAAFSFVTTSPPSPWERLGFSFHHGTQQFSASSMVRTPVWGVVVPYWSVVAAGAAPPLAALAWSCRRRPTPGLCRSCGYDLRATPDRCPECGTIASTTG